MSTPPLPIILIELTTSVPRLLLIGNPSSCLQRRQTPKAFLNRSA